MPVVPQSLRPDLLASRVSAPALVVLLTAVLIYAFWDGLAWSAQSWQSAEYNHCWLIPAISLFLLATWAPELKEVVWSRSPTGVALVALGFVMLLLGEISVVYPLIQYGFLVAFWGVVLAMLGAPAVARIWPALAYLLFMVPLPDFLQVKLSADLQLISSKLGVAVIRLVGVPVYLEGNIIDLGNYQLAVAEACNGLRYLFPLMSFGFLCAALFQVPTWQRIVAFLSTIPITVLMNSIRVGVIGILVNYRGIEHAEGFMHYFEGWVVFMLCVGILFAEMFLMSTLSGREFLKSLRMETPPLRELMAIASRRPVNATLAAAAAIAVAGTLVAATIEYRPKMVPQDPNLEVFPLVISEWQGTEQGIDPRQLEALQTDGKVSAVYSRDGDGAPVALWMAYYASQNKGRVVHSPKTCLPGGGWQIRSFEEALIPEVRADGGSLPVNRAVIGIGDQEQLVYYWFVQRGRLVTNEYLVKWYIFWDALTWNRTDGALVRLVTPVESIPSGMEAAEQRLQDFARAIDPKLSYFLPQENALLRVAATDG